MNDQIEIKDLDQGVPVQADWLVFQKVSDGVVYKAPKSDIEGEDAFVYIGYADDDIGTGFTLTFNANKDYIAIKSTNTEIANPVVGDFNGLWKNYKGQKGDTGDTGAKPISVAFSGNNMVFVLEDSSTITLTNAKIDLKGDKGDTGKGITSIVKTGTLGLVDTYTITYSDSTTSTFDVTNGADGTDGTDGISFTPKGAYNALTEYVANDVVSYLGSTWIALQTTTGNTPEEGAYWTLNAAKGTDGEGAGDMLASVYDPTNVAGDAFDMDNMAQGTTNKFLSSAELTVVQNTSGTNTGDQEATDFDIKDLTDSTSLRDTWSAKQDSLGFTPENVANKVTSFQATPDDTHYPSEKLVKDSLDSKANANNVLALDNTTPFTPDNDYEPATKKYVDDNAGSSKTTGTEISSATPTINTDLYDEYILSAQTGDITSFSTNLSGTPQNGDKLNIRINKATNPFSFINSAEYDSASSNSAVVTKPTNTADGDLMIAVCSLGTAGITPNSIPAGWTVLPRNANNYTCVLYKIASSEGANYTFGFASSYKVRVTILTYRGGFNPINPIDGIFTDTDVSSGTSANIPKTNVISPYSPLIYIGAVNSTTSKTFTKPSVPNTDWVENYDAGNTESDVWQTVCSMVYGSSGSIANIAATVSGSAIGTSFVVVLNPTITITWGASFNLVTSYAYSGQEFNFEWNSTTELWEEVFSPQNYDTIITTYNLATATGTQVIPHKLKKIPKKVKITMEWINTTMFRSEGISDSTGDRCLMSHFTTTHAIEYSNEVSIGAKVSISTFNNSAAGTLTYDDHNITISWVKRGTITGTAYLLLEVE